MSKGTLPLTPLLQKLKDNRKVAAEFYKEYLALCDKYSLQIGTNFYGTEIVESIDAGNTSVPTWNLLKEQNDN